MVANRMEIIDVANQGLTAVALDTGELGPCPAAQRQNFSATVLTIAARAIPSTSDLRLKASGMNEITSPPIGDRRAAQTDVSI
jgi:hypothetical protein